MEYTNLSMCDSALSCMLNDSGSLQPVHQNSSYSLMPVVPLYIHVLFSLLYGIIFFLGVGGNILVIYVILHSKSMHSPTNYLLLNLALSDFLVILICLPTAFVDIFSKDAWYLGAFMCHLVYFLENSTAVASVLTITAICIERFCAICRRKFVNRWIGLVVAILWTVAFSVCIPFLLMATHKDSTQLDGNPIKVCKVYTNSTVKKSYLTAFSVFFYVLPCVILVLFYYLIVKHINQETMAIHNEETLTASRRISLSKRRQAIHMLRMVTFLCFICLLPFHGLRVLSLYVNIYSNFSLEGYMLFLNMSRVAFYVNSTVNPLIYNVFSSKFKAAFKHALGCATTSETTKFSRMTLTTM